MRRAFVLVTAIPPTIGHARLIEFASHIAPTTVIVTTQPDEPFFRERAKAFRDRFGRRGIEIDHLHRTLPQDPETPGFREMWRNIMINQHGFKPGDVIVASETYGAWLAEICGGTFMPYDIKRAVVETKASSVRSNPIDRWNEIMPEFRRYMTTRVTLFGAESVGKTTLSKALGFGFDLTSIPEYARPYLEAVGNEITNEKMENIWMGQAALQQSALEAGETPILIQDTDLFSTVGYYGLYDPAAMPAGLLQDAIYSKSDLYVVLSTEGVPFEQDPLRYGGHQRESDDAYWISLCERYDLNYVVVYGNVTERLSRIEGLIWEYADAKAAQLNYQREAND